MSRSLLVTLFLLALAGCVWPPTSDVAPPAYRDDLSFSVHQTINYRVAGGADTTNVVWPTSYYSGYYDYIDSVRYIIVNGDTAFRHPSHSNAPVLDSSVRYFIDGRQNVVSMIFTTNSRTDTISESGLQAGITAPAIGDTILRDSAATWYYATDEFTPGSYNMLVTVTDSLHPYSEATTSDVGSIEFRAGELTRFRSGPLWVMLRVTSHYNGYYYYTQRTVLVDRVVPYVLK